MRFEEPSGKIHGLNFFYLFFFLLAKADLT